MGKRLIIIGIVVLLGVGGFFGWKMFVNGQGPEAFVSTLNKTLVAGDLASLVKLVDFRALTQDMAQQILNNPQVEGVVVLNTKTLSGLSQSIEQVFIKNIQGEPAKPNANKKEDPFASLEPIPVDFSKQITGKFTFLGMVNQGAMVTVTFNHARLKKDVTLNFLAQQLPDWKITKLMNMPELLKEYLTEEKKILDARRKVFEMQRAQDKKRIEQQFQLDECVAFVHQPSGQKYPLLTVRVKGYNNGPFTIRSMTFDTKITIHGDGGELVYNHDISTASLLRVGITLEDSYVIDVEKHGKELEFLNTSTQVSCAAFVKFMTLDDGKILYIADDDKNKK